jgi:hypothetical protein
VAKLVLREVSVRFCEVFDELVEKKIVKNMKEFCKKLDYLPQSMTQVRGGKRDVTLDTIMKLWNVFGGNPVYVMLGVGDKILDKNALPTIPEKSVSLDSSAESKLIKSLENLVESKIETITLLKTEVERLTIELKNQKK